MATHSLEVPLPGAIPPPPPIKPDPVRNKVVLTAGGTIIWNDGAVSQGQLLALLQETTRYPIEPELQFEPEAEASYDLSARVLNIIKLSGVTKFGFVGNERYKTFSRS
jgi:biopolymer transport protein ExbD